MSGTATPPLKWSSPDLEGLLQFLVQEKSFNEQRVRSAVERINSAKGKASQGEGAARVLLLWVKPNCLELGLNAWQVGPCRSPGVILRASEGDHLHVGSQAQGRQACACSEEEGQGWWRRRKEVGDF